MSIVQLDILFQYILMPATISYLAYINKILNRYYVSENIYPTELKRNQRGRVDPLTLRCFPPCRPVIRALSVFQMFRLSIQRTFKKCAMKPRSRSLMRSPMHPKEQLRIGIQFWAQKSAALRIPGICVFHRVLYKVRTMTRTTSPRGSPSAVHSEVAMAGFAPPWSHYAR